METSLARDLMSDEEWAFHERFISTVRAPNGRKPTNHRLVLDGIFWIARTGAPTIVYVSFDAATLARDLRWFAARGYEPDHIVGFDLFPGTAHVETVVRLRASG